MSTKDDDKKKPVPALEEKAEDGITSLAKAQMLEAIETINNRLTDRVNAFRMYGAKKLVYDIRDMVLDLRTMAIFEEVKKGNLN